MKTILPACAILLIAILYPAEGFHPNNLAATVAKLASFSTEDAITHEEMTKSALFEVANEVLFDNRNPSDAQSSQRLSALSNPNEESLITAYYGQDDYARINAFEDVVKVVLNANSQTDFKEYTLAAAHFDSEQFESGQERLIALRQSVVSSIQAGNYDAAQKDTGRMLHTLQDFYSHTNWIENGDRAPNPVLGQPNRKIANTAGPNQQTCTDCVKSGLITHYKCRDNIVKSLIQNGILTSGYYDGQVDTEGQVIDKPTGKCSHGGFNDPSRKLSAEGGINKDGPYYRTSPHYYLHAEAAAVAQQATADMLRDIRKAVNDDQSFGAYLGIRVNPVTVGSSTSTGNRAYLRERIRNALLQRYMNRISGKNLKYWGGGYLTVRSYL